MSPSQPGRALSFIIWAILSAHFRLLSDISHESGYIVKVICRGVLIGSPTTGLPIRGGCKNLSVWRGVPKRCRSYAATHQEGWKYVIEVDETTNNQ
jgi:hypothetical protein